VQVYFTTVIRDAPPRKGGELVWVDWQTKQVRRRVPIVATNPALNDPNPGSSTRGGRGVEVFADTVIVASYHTLRVYDRNLRHQRDVSHPLMVGLHETHAQSASEVWVSSTAIDAALKIDMETASILAESWPRERATFQEQLKVAPQTIDKGVDNRGLFLSPATRKLNHLHLNAVAVWREEVFAHFAKFGAIVNLDRGEVTIQDPALRGGHNLIILDDGTAVVNDTYGRSVRFYDLKGKTLKRVINLTSFPSVRALLARHNLVYHARRILRKAKLYPHRPPRPLFVRGLSMLGDQLFVGVSPAAILHLDWRRGELMDMFCYSHDVGVCVHGLKAVADRQSVTAAQRDVNGSGSPRSQRAD